MTAPPTPDVKAHQSYSGLADWLRCPKLYQLRRELGVPESPGYARAGGSAVHAATEAYDRMVGFAK